MNENNTNLPVIVGYDTSPESAFALEWATRVAQHRGCALRVISAADIDLSSIELARPGIQEMYLDQARQQAQEGADLAKTFAAGILVTSEGQPGSAAGALVNASRQGSLLVVGHRARGLLPDMLLGSVAFKATHHAACPVAIVRKSPRPLPCATYPVVAGVDGSEHGTHALQEAARLAADTGSFLRIRSGASGAAVSFDVGQGVLKELAGKHAVFDVIARAEDGKDTQMSVDCNFGELGDCGRKRYGVGHERNEYLFEVEFPAKQPGAAGTIAINSDFDKAGKAVDIYAIQVSVTDQ